MGVCPRANAGVITDSVLAGHVFVVRIVGCVAQVSAFKAFINVVATALVARQHVTIITTAVVVSFRILAAMIAVIGSRVTLVNIWAQN